MPRRRRWWCVIRRPRRRVRCRCTSPRSRRRCDHRTDRPITGRPATAPPTTTRPRTKAEPHTMTAASRPEPAAPRRDAGPSVLASTGSMAIATLISRVTGFVKILLMAAVLGPATASAFQVSNTLPNLISELVLGAVLTAIVIPVLVRAEREDADGGTAFVRRLLTAALTIFTVAMVASVAAAPWLTRLMLTSHAKVDVPLATEIGRAHV